MDEPWQSGLVPCCALKPLFSARVLLCITKDMYNQITSTQLATIMNINTTMIGMPDTNMGLAHQTLARID